MTQYIREIKKQFRDKYHFKPSRVVEGEPCFDSIPDGEYPMKIDGKLDYVRVKAGGISCCNDKSEKHPNGELSGVAAADEAARKEK